MNHDTRPEVRTRAAVRGAHFIFRTQRAHAVVLRITALILLATVATAAGACSFFVQGAPPKSTVGGHEKKQDRAYHRQVLAVLESAAGDLEEFERSGSSGSLAVGLGRLSGLALVSPPPWHLKAHAKLVSTIGQIQSTGADFYQAGAEGNLLKVTVAGSSFISAMEQAQGIYNSMERYDAKHGLDRVALGSVPPGESATLTVEAYREEVDNIATDVNSSLGSLAASLRERDSAQSDSALDRLTDAFRQSALLEPPPDMSESHLKLVEGLYGYAVWAQELREAIGGHGSQGIQTLADSLDNIGYGYREALDEIGAPGTPYAARPGTVLDEEGIPTPTPYASLKKAKPGDTVYFRAKGSDGYVSSHKNDGTPYAIFRVYDSGKKAHAEPWVTVDSLPNDILPGDVVSAEVTVVYGGDYGFLDCEYRDIWRAKKHEAPKPAKRVRQGSVTWRRLAKATVDQDQLPGTCRLKSAYMKSDYAVGLVGCGDGITEVLMYRYQPVTFGSKEKEWTTVGWSDPDELTVQRIEEMALAEPRVADALSKAAQAWSKDKD